MGLKQMHAGSTQGKDLDELPVKDRIRLGYKVAGDGMVLTTSGGATSALLPHLTHKALASTPYEPPIIFVDTGYYPDATHEQIDYLRQQGFKLKVYKPHYTREEIESEYGQWWNNDDVFEEVVEIIKHEPLNRAFRDQEAKLWVNGIRHYQTQKRAEADYIEQKNGILRMHPLLDLDKATVETYHDRYDLRKNEAHFDITKGILQKQECGIHERCGKA